MPNSTLITLTQNALQGMGFAHFDLPAALINNTNINTTQVLALINMEGDAQSREHDWEALKTQNIFTATFFQYTGTSTNESTNLTSMSSIASLDDTFMVTGLNIPQDTLISGTPSGTTVVLNREATGAATGTTFTFSKVRFAKPAGFDRQIDRTHWDVSQRWEMLGPLTSQQSMWLRSGYISTGPRIRYWFEGDLLQIWPPLGTRQQLTLMYLSKHWIFATGATATTKQYFTLDTDTCIFPDALMHSLIRLKFREAKGLETGVVFDDYKKQLDLAKAHDGGSLTLDMAPSLSNVLIGWDNIPDSGYGG